MCFIKRSLLLFFVLLGCSTAKADVSSTYTRIVGGDPVTNLAQFSYQVSLRRLTSMSHFCGGVILNSNHILTAAHCMFVENKLIGAHEVYAVTGTLLINPLPSHSLTSKVKYIFIHELYDPNEYDNDIAVMRLMSNITMNDQMRSIPLSTTSIGTNVNCFASGWGYLREGGALSNRLMSVSIPIVDHNTCAVLYSQSSGGTIVSLITNNMICAGTRGKDSCQGDSGGPLRCNGLLGGLVSFGNGCAKDGYPGVYTDVSKYQGWIKTQVDRNAALCSIAPHYVIFVLFSFISLRQTNLF